MNTTQTQRFRFLKRVAAAALLALALPAAGEAGGPLDLVSDARGHVAVSQSHTARFDGAAFELAAQPGKAAEAGPSLRFQLLEVRKGGTLVASRDGRPPEVRVTGNRIAYLRGGGFVERYDVREDGVEQSFVLRRRGQGVGDLTITGSLEADRELGKALPDGSGGLVVPFADGPSKLRYGAVTVVDAAGARRAGALAIEDGRVTITVDGAWLATAAYPVVVDPLITIDSNGTYQGRPAAAFDFGGSSGIPGATEARYLVAYETEQLGVPRQIGSRIVPWTGGTWPPSGSPVNISANSKVAHTKPTVAFKFGKIDSPRRNYLVAWQRSDGGLGYRILDRSGRPLMPPAKIAGERFQDVTAAAGPRGGWGASNCKLPIGCTPYLLAYRSWSSFGAGPVSTVRLALVDDGTGAKVSDSTVESFFPGVDDPTYAPHIAYGHSDSADYFVLTYRRPNTQIVARKVTPKGEIGPAYVVASLSDGPPVVAYSHASKRWGVFWRTTELFGTRAAIQGRMFAANPVEEPLSSLGVWVTATTVPLGGSGTPASVLPDYSVAGSHTATEYSPFQGLFELAYVTGGEVYSVKVYAGGTLSSSTRLTTSSVQDRYVKLAVTRIDPLTTGLPSPLSCTAMPGSRCALWVFESFFKAVDHDIVGFRTNLEY